ATAKFRVALVRESGLDAFLALDTDPCGRPRRARRHGPRPPTQSGRQNRTSDLVTPSGTRTFPVFPSYTGRPQASSEEVMTSWMGSSIVVAAVVALGWSAADNDRPKAGEVVALPGRESATSVELPKLPPITLPAPPELAA